VEPEEVEALVFLKKGQKQSDLRCTSQERPPVLEHSFPLLSAV